MSDEQACGWRALHGRENDDTEVVGRLVPGLRGGVRGRRGRVLIETFLTLLRVVMPGHAL